MSFIFFFVRPFKVVFLRDTGSGTTAKFFTSLGSDMIVELLFPKGDKWKNNMGERLNKNKIA